MKYSALVIAMWLPVSACGGKILDERATGSSGVAGTPSTSSDEATPAPQRAPGLGTSAPPVSHSDNPCATICETNGGCVGGQTDCARRCAEDLASTSCSVEARAYIGCYADNVQACSELPPACESAYCAYTLCAGKVVPSYCR